MAQTRSPWDPRRGSSGSSAGSAAAAAAGLVGFAIGSETNGSIISPCRACGASGLRPTYGRISRHGCMTLAWSLDKLGPIARSVEDFALILDAIHGADGLDPTAVDAPFAWPGRTSVRGLKVGYFADRDQGSALDRRSELKALRDLGATLLPIKLPESYPIEAVGMMLGTEAATVFDELTRQHVSEGLNSWPASFRAGQFVPAVEYLRAARVRTLLMREMARLFDTVDVYIGETEDMTLTNLTGHPSVVFPRGFSPRDGRDAPGSVTITGRLLDESTLLAVSVALQDALGDHLRRPPLEQFLTEANGQDEAKK